MPMAPSKANRIGAAARRSFRPERLPASAAEKSPSATLASTGSPCQTKRPVAPKVLEIDGHASDNCTSLSVSEILRPGSLATTVPSLILISVKAATREAPAIWLCASAAIKPDQLDWPFAAMLILMVGCSSATSAISTRPTSSGKKRSRAVSRSAVSAGCAASPSTTSAKLTLPRGNSDTVTSPRNIGLRPVTARISPITCARTSSREISAVAAPSTTAPSTTTAASPIARRLNPEATVKGMIFQRFFQTPADYTTGAACANRGRCL